MAPNSTACKALSLSLAAASVCGLSQNVDSRRTFFAKVPSIVGASASMGFLLNFDHHGIGCQCGNCSSEHVSHGAGCDCGDCTSSMSHAAGCNCGQCHTSRFSFGPQAAAAYERDVGADGTRSSTTAAMNIQAKQTNARLEKDGFKLDTKEEEKARLADAMSSFSYESSSSSGKNQPAKEYKSNKKS